MKNRILIKTSGDLLYALKTNQNHQKLVESLSLYLKDEILFELNDDESKKTFWINIYNAFFQILRKHENLQHPEIYKSQSIQIGNYQLSLDDIEHGLLRRFRYKYSLGYFRKPFIPNNLKPLAVDKIDFRIHFALNCGAESCPPIAFYSLDKIDQQLDLATESFIQSSTQLNSKNKTIFISKLFKWYLGDFGGRSGIRRILSKFLNQDIHLKKIKFQDYSWDEKLDNYSI